MVDEVKEGGGKVFSFFGLFGWFGVVTIWVVRRKGESIMVTLRLLPYQYLPTTLRS